MKKCYIDRLSKGFQKGFGGAGTRSHAFLMFSIVVQ